MIRSFLNTLNMCSVHKIGSKFRCTLRLIKNCVEVCVHTMDVLPTDQKSYNQNNSNDEVSMTEIATSTFNNQYHSLSLMAKYAFRIYNAFLSLLKHEIDQLEFFCLFFFYFSDKCTLNMCLW